MIRIANRLIELTCNEDGTGLVLRDIQRGLSWKLDEQTRRCRIGGDKGDRPLGAGMASALDTGAVVMQFVVEGEFLTLLWELKDDYVEVTATFGGDGGRLQSVALPGSFAPAEGKLTLALPIMQGLLFDGRGPSFEESVAYGGHERFSMAMMGYLAPRGSLLAAVESFTDWDAVVGKRDDGSTYAFCRQLLSLGAMRYLRKVRLYPCDAGLTALCKRYRQRAKERGWWKHWDEKIAERPVVEQLFGSLMAFIGYCQGPTDYVASCRRLRDMGFDRAFIYPVRFCAPVMGFLMGGKPPINLGEADIAAIKALGYNVAPWAWVFEALDDGSDALRRTFRIGPDGKKITGWRIDQQQWHPRCTPYQIRSMREAYAGPMRDMTWVHYDVNATLGPLECFAADHDLHAGGPLDKRGDYPFVRELFGVGVNGNRAVSSEGFVDRFAADYHIGSTKLLPSFGAAEFWTVPMTMLVYHDSVVHDWWEVHNYNSLGDKFRHTYRWGVKDSGFPRLKAAMDALMGCPPNVFPFGSQYYWNPPGTPNTAEFTLTLDDPSVQEALEAALPVTRLHRRIGKCSLDSHEFLSEDGAVQTTTFSDGTRVVANFDSRPREAPGVGQVQPEGWRLVE
ncbi:MAG: hypothetical protein ACE15C_20490 [Phycisphaerae bacterium]